MVKTHILTGLKWIRALTENGNTEMRIDLMNHLNITAYQVFQDFRLGQGRGYKLNVGSSSGTAGIFLRLIVEGKQVYTFIVCF